MFKILLHIPFFKRKYKKSVKEDSLIDLVKRRIIYEMMLELYENEDGNQRENPSFCLCRTLHLVYCNTTIPTIKITDLRELMVQKPANLSEFSFWWRPGDPEPRIAALKVALGMVDYSIEKMESKKN